MEQQHSALDVMAPQTGEDEIERLFRFYAAETKRLRSERDDAREQQQQLESRLASTQKLMKSLEEELRVQQVLRQTMLGHQQQQMPMFFPAAPEWKQEQHQPPPLQWRSASHDSEAMTSERDSARKLRVIVTRHELERRVEAHESPRQQSKPRRRSRSRSPQKFTEPRQPRSRSPSSRLRRRSASPSSDKADHEQQPRPKKVTIHVNVDSFSIAKSIVGPDGQHIRRIRKWSNTWMHANRDDETRQWSIEIRGLPENVHRAKDYVVEWNLGKAPKPCLWP